ncbi:MAG: NrsF family protein [Alphaproteobacteria bacterium]
MADTDALIRRLVDQSGRVGRLPPPWKRALLWLGWSLPWVAFVVLIMGVRPDLVQKLSDSRFLLEQIAAFAAALLAGFAAFCAVVPGRPRWLLLLPALPIAVWLGSLGQGCIQAWMGGNLVFGVDWVCFPSIAFVGAVPALLMAFMLRRGAPLYPHLAVALGGLAAAALGNVGLRLFHPIDASLMVLVWQFGSVALMTALAGCIGPLVHHWRHVPAGR